MRLAAFTASQNSLKKGRTSAELQEKTDAARTTQQCRYLQPEAHSHHLNLTDKNDSLWISEMRLRVVPGFISPPPGFGGFCYTPTARILN
ncbi:hypothetical protein GKF04_25170 [Escherichia coli]|nr:hypothetical protein [Escherichia coli]